MNLLSFILSDFLRYKDKMNDLWEEYLKGWEYYERKEYIQALTTFQSIQPKMDHHKIREWILKESIEQVLEEMGIYTENNSQIPTLSMEEYEFVRSLIGLRESTMVDSVSTVGTDSENSPKVNSVKMQMRFLPKIMKEKLQEKIKQNPPYQDIWDTYNGC